MSKELVQPGEATDATDATLTASRALLGIVARSVADALERVTLPQFRVLVVVSTEGPLRLRTLAERLGVHQSTFSRSVDRMVAAGWVTRAENPDSRREVLVDLTPAGRRLVESVTERRRQAIQRVLARLTEEQRSDVVRVLSALNDAAGEPAAEDLLVLGL